MSINPIKKIIIDIQINACKINKIQLGFVLQKILGPEPIKYVAKYWLSQRRRTWCTTWWPHPTESAAYQCTGRPPQINPTRLKKNTIHDGTSQSHGQGSLLLLHHSKGGSSKLDHHKHRLQPLSCLSRLIGHLTRLPRLTRPNRPPRPTQSRRRPRSRRRSL